MLKACVTLGRQGLGERVGDHTMRLAVLDPHGYWDPKPTRHTRQKPNQTQGKTPTAHPNKTHKKLVTKSYFLVTKSYFFHLFFDNHKKIFIYFWIKPAVTRPMGPLVVLGQLTKAFN